MLKILIVYASFGKGHQKAAQAIGEHLSASSYDLLDFSNKFLKRIYDLSYKLSTQYFPFVWRVIFHLAGKEQAGYFISKIQEKIFASFLCYLRQVKPQVVIATHFFPASLAASLKNEWDFKLVSIITDLGVHPLWVDEGVDFYFTALDMAKEYLINRGVEGRRIISGVVSLRRGFFKEAEGQRLENKFFVNKKPVILFIFSLSGNFLFLKLVVKYLLDDFNVFVIYGGNRRIKKYLETVTSSQLRFCEFYEDIWEIIDCSFVIVSKPGGLTVFEGIYKRKPFIFTGYIPGQEKVNMDLLLKYNVARFAKTKDKFIEAVYYFKDKTLAMQREYPLKVKSIETEMRKLIERF